MKTIPINHRLTVIRGRNGWVRPEAVTVHVQPRASLNPIGLAQVQLLSQRLGDTAPIVLSAEGPDAAYKLAGLLRDVADALVDEHHTQGGEAPTPAAEVDCRLIPREVSGG